MGHPSTADGPPTASRGTAAVVFADGDDPVNAQADLERGSGFMRITFTEPSTKRVWFSVLLATSWLTSWLEQHGECSPTEASGESS
jgi:hypothetical protein